MKAFEIVLLVLAPLSLAVGCSFKIAVNEKNETDMGSHHVVVKPGSTFTSSSSSSGGQTETFQYTCGDFSITIQNEELIVNNVSYGKLNPDDSVLIDNGKVLVENQERKGTPMSDDDILAAAPVKETTKKLAGYNVTVRPGASFTSTTQILGKHTLTVGETKVSIKKDELFVDGRSYGRLNQGDTILVENSQVHVSGEPRDVTK